MVLHRDAGVSSVLGAAQTPVPWMQIVWVAAALVGAVGAFVAFPMFFFAARDRQKVLLRQEVADEARRREQLEVRTSELTKERDTLRDQLAEERKRPNVNGIAEVLQGVAKTNVKILDRLHDLNGGLGKAVRAMEDQTAAVRELVAKVTA